MISETSIQTVLETADIVEVVQRTGLELKKSGANWMGKSPYKDEKTPSFSVSPSKQIFKCFSTGNGGNVITYLMSTQGLSFPDSVKFLADMYGIQLEFTGEEVSEEKKDHLERLQEVLEFARIKWKRYLKDTPEESDHWIELLGNRKLTHSTIDRWEIGMAPDDWNFLKDDILPKGRFGEAEQVGILQQTSGKPFDVFRNRIMFPIRNHGGKLVGFGGRLISGNGPKYLNSKDSEVYHKQKILFGLHLAGPAIRKMGFVMITEGYFDVISLHQQGLENTVATCGTALTVDQCKLLKRYTTRARLLYDGDNAGQKAMERALPILLEEGFQVEVIQLPEDTDPDDLCRSFSQHNQDSHEEEKQPEKTM